MDSFRQRAGKAHAALMTVPVEGSWFLTEEQLTATRSATFWQMAYYQLVTHGMESPWLLSEVEVPWSYN